MTKITKSVSEFSREKHHTSGVLVAGFFILGSMILNAALPESFDHVISYEGTSYTSSLSFFSNRGPNFQVQKQKDDGTFDVLEVPIVRTYIGTVQGVPGATVSAVRFDSGMVFYRVVFEDGREWINTGGRTELLCDKGANNACVEPDLKFPDFVVGEGGAGSLIYGVEVGVDMPFHQFDGVHASDVVAALSIIEYSFNSTNALYMREAGIKHELGRVVIRASRTQDPYRSDVLPAPPCAATDTCYAGQENYARLIEVFNQWGSVLPGPKTYDMTLVINNSGTGNGGGGVARPPLGTFPAYSSNDTTEGIGDFSKVWRHEAGHNWGNPHYTGNAPEGGTIMSNNKLGRFSGPEQKLVLDVKKANLNEFTSLGALKIAMAPNASMDSFIAGLDDSTSLDVLGNDHDANGDTLSIVEVDSTSYLGAATEISQGQENDGRDRIIYYPTSDAKVGDIDRFKYRVKDSSGLESVGFVYLQIVDNSNWVYKQDFNNFSNGKPSFNDGTLLSSDSEIVDGELLLHPLGLFRRYTYQVPKFFLQQGVNTKFKFKADATTNSYSSQALSVNFGERAPSGAQNQGYVEGSHAGYLSGLTIEFDFNIFSLTKGYRILVDNKQLSGGYLADSNLGDGNWREVEIDWHESGSLDVTVDGVAVFSSLNTSPFQPTSSDLISFTGSSAGYRGRQSLDNIEVSGHVKENYSSDRYQFINTPMTWSDAAAYAKGRGGSLVKIESVEQNVWLKNYLKEATTTAPDGGGAIYSWLGATDSAKEGAWLWEDGTAVPLNNSGTVWWGNGSGHDTGASEPDNSGGTQHCLAMGLSGWPIATPGFYGTAGQWNDINCGNKLAFAIQYPNELPTVSIVGGSQSVSDTDDKAGELVSLTATASDNDGTIASTEWRVAGSKVASGLNAKILLPNGPTTVTFTATDNNGASSSISATVTIPFPQDLSTDKWPSPYNGSTPDPSLGLAFNNIGVLNSSDSTIYTCLGLFSNGLPSSANGISQFDIGLQVVSASDATVQITKSREFNIIGALNENAQSPDCSGVFETTRGLYTDIIKVSNSILETTWTLIDANNLILKLTSSKDLGAN